MKLGKTHCPPPPIQTKLDHDEGFDLSRSHATEVTAGDRFRFGENWSRFLTLLDDARIQAAEDSLRKMLGRDSLAGLSFLDIGSGSGLFSLAARRLGARVHSIDFDPHSVACTNELNRRYFSDDPSWTIEEASVLDEAYIRALTPHDIVYSWGVLHHTGQMYRALENVVYPVAVGGLLFIAIYNDQGWISRYWVEVKRLYNRNLLGKAIVLAINIPHMFVLRWIYRKIIVKQHIERGMSLWFDMIDWVGGYPFEVAKPEDIFRLFRDRGFHLIELKTCGGGAANNEFVFLRES